MPAEPSLPITFLSDYGLEDEFAGVCRAVIERIAPGARVINLGHGVPRGDVRQGAVRLAGALPFAPAGVHLAVVDPGVGGERRAVAIRCAGAPTGPSGSSGTEQRILAGPDSGPLVPAGERVLVGPDNGLLMPAAEHFGGVEEAVDIGDSPVRLEPVSATFHGRDIFAPVAAHLARGAPLKALGEPIPVESLVDLELPPARVTLSCEGNMVETEVLAIDTFGNASLSTTLDDLVALAGGEDDEDAGVVPGELEVDEPTGSDGLPDPATADTSPDSVTIELAGLSRRVPVRPTFSAVPPGQPVLLTDSSGRLALAVNQSSAANQFSLTPGTHLRLT